ncbi:MAG: 4Fe-4S binding protein, partial [Gemmatimonadota bacterium]|nr:4Fe-4S binding protein [Gemmatimonadota bacterium]
AGIGSPGRFWEQVCYLYKTGDDGIADPFAALSAIPAATSTIRDMTDVRFEVPEFIAEKCTGCGQCWVQCPDAAIPGLVNEVEEVLDTAIRFVSNGRSLDRLRQITKHLGNESRKIMKGVPFTTFGAVLSEAYKTVVDKMKLDPERRAALDAEFAPVYAVLEDFPLAKTTAFFDLPEGREKNTGGCSRSRSIRTRARAAISACTCVPTRRSSRSSRPTRSSTSSAKTGSSGNSCPTPTTGTSTCRTSRRASACCRRSC